MIALHPTIRSSFGIRPALRAVRRRDVGIAPYGIGD